MQGHSVIEDECASQLAAEDIMKHDMDDEEQYTASQQPVHTHDKSGDAAASTDDAHTARGGREIESVEGVYFFYQAADGERSFMHPLSMRCLLEQYGGYTELPQRIEARVLEVERFAQVQETRK